MVNDTGPDGRALFVVGCGRSGTTLAYQLLCQHDAFAWISTWCDRTGRPELALANRRWREHPDGRRVPLPSEAYRTWDRISPEHAGAASPPLTAADVTAPARRSMARVHRGYTRYAGGEVFLNKNTRNTRRIDYLRELCPGGAFLHVLRHPMDAISSQLRVTWWLDLELWTQGGATPRGLGVDAVGEARLAAELWVAETQRALDDGRASGAAYVETRYEDLVTDPVAQLTPALGAVGVEPHPGFAERVGGWELRSSVGAYRSRLSAAQQDVIAEVAGELAHDLGYDLEGA